MQPRRILRKVTLKRNSTGTFYAEFEEDDTVRIAYLGKQRVKNKHFYSVVTVERSYLASIDVIDDDKAFVEQLIVLSEEQQSKEPTEATYRCKWLDNASVVLQGKDQESRLTLSTQILSPFAYRIFHNSEVVVSFGHDQNGFFIKQWLTTSPENIGRGILTSVSKASTNPKAPYDAKYFVSENTYLPDTYLPVKIWPRSINKLGIQTLTEQACIAATIIIDDEKKLAVVTPAWDPEFVLEKYNTPQANLSFLGAETINSGKVVYQFETELIDGISLSVSVWPNELDYIIDDTALLQKGLCIQAHLSFQISDTGWCNFQLPIALNDHYSELFRCMVMKQVDKEYVALLEAIESPHDRVLIPRSALVKQGVYAINPSTVLHLEITRDTKFKPWEIVEIGKGVFTGIKDGASYQGTCTILMPWSRYDNQPDYLTRLARSRQSYAFANHCIASISTEYAELLLLIPVSLLAGNGFRTLAADDTLLVAFKKIEFPVFDTTSIPILCADIVLSEEPPSTYVDNGAYVMADFVKRVPPKNTEDRYLFSIVDSEDTVEFIDRRGQLSNIAELDKYRYQICITHHPAGLYVKELISASVK